MTSISIGNKKIGTGKPVFIIAEAGVNHNGDVKLARKLIDVAAASEADAIKFQTFNPDTLVTRAAAKAQYQGKNLGVLGKEETQYEMLKRLMLKRGNHQELKTYAEQKGLIFLSTPFSLSDAEFLRDLGIVALKVGSSDTNNLPYLRTIAKWKLPIILSTGMADVPLIRESVEVIQKAGNRELVVLHCTTNYPAPIAEANVCAMQTIERELKVLVGFSDHTEGTTASILSVALGASIIEKHLTLDKAMTGPDHMASLNPQEFTAFVAAIRNAECALGTGKKVIFSSEADIAKVARKSLVTSRLVKKGEKFDEQNLTVKRPGTGRPPAFFDKVLGKKATRDLPLETLVTDADFC